MLIKLRNRMLLINMLSIFCILIIAFTVIFAITYSSVERQIDESIQRAFFIHKPRFNNNVQFNQDKIAPPQNIDHMERKHKIDDMRSFLVFVDADGKMHTESMLGENSEMYEQAALTVLNEKNAEGSIINQNIYWRYKTRKLDDNSRYIALVDITSERNMLVRLVISFIISAILLLIFIFLFSLYFADKSMKPVNEAWEKQKRFVSDASHELKTPLSAINTNIDVILSSPDSKVKEQEKWLEYIKSETKRLSELTHNLLYMAKIDGEKNTQIKIINISDIVEKTVLNLEAVAFENKKTFSYDIDKNISLKADESEFTRLCLILIDNAIKYSFQDTQIDIALKRQAKGHAVFWVENKGNTISKEEQDKIFDRFYRVDKARTFNGYGLGLSMAKEIANLHGWKIKVTSENNVTKFMILM